MTILLSRPYAGMASGSVVSLSTNVEAALIAQGFATTSAAALTTGAQTMNVPSGSCSIAAGASSIVITNNLVDANSVVYAVVAQASADGTLLRVERVVPAAGSFTIYGTANATAAVVIDWAVLNPIGQFTVNG